MSGNTNAIGLSINSSNPLNLLNGGIGRSVTATSGSALFYDSTGIQQNNANFHWDNTNLGLSIGTTTYNAPLTVQVSGGTTYATALAAYFGSVVGGVAGNLYHITIAKGSYEAALFGINKNTTTGNNIPATCVYLSTYSNTGAVVIGQGNNAGLPNNAALIVTNQVNIPNLTASNLVATDPSNNLVSTNTLSSTILGNITKITITKLTSGSGTYTPPANCTHIRVRAWGAGGGAGGIAGNAASTGASGGGASGGYFESVVISPTATSYSIGAGGAGGAAGNNQGISGGNTTFGTFTAAGGFGGSGYNSGIGAGTALGGNSQTNSGSPNISFIGNPGLPGITISAAAVVSGAGGAAPGGGGAATGVNGNFSGLNGSSPGAGGGGAASTNGSSFAGGNGAAGLIIIEEYYNG
jgi:hypothetical protein